MVGPESRHQSKRIHMKPRAIPIRLKTLTVQLDQCLRGCSTVLEVGCGEDSPAQYLAHRYRMVGLDLFEPALVRAKARGILTDFHLGDALSISEKFSKGEFDAVIALDLIEHLEKEKGFELLDAMEQVAGKRVVVFTPNGFLDQPADDNPWMQHRSGWSTEDFRARNYRVHGSNGWKPLRGAYAKIKWKPRLIWGAFSELTQHLWTRNHPESAFSILACKALPGA